MAYNFLSGMMHVARIVQFSELCLNCNGLRGYCMGSMLDTLRGWRGGEKNTVESSTVPPTLTPYGVIIIIIIIII